MRAQANDELQHALSTLRSVEEDKVVELSEASLAAFFANWARPTKAILFTTKPEVPPLWRELAEAQSMSTAFAVVRHSDAALMAHFGLTAAELPRICMFRELAAEPVNLLKI